MKKLVFHTLLLFAGSLYSQSLEGSWMLKAENGQQVADKEVIRIYKDNYFAEGAKKLGSNEFLWALGGEYTNDEYSRTLDFNTRSGEEIGVTQTPALKFEGENTIHIIGKNEDQVWERITANQNDISGNWVITGRKRNGEMNSIKPGDRRTIKILGGDRFQWVAFNSATKEFMGIGGGTYTADNGKYIEKITFFSRDNNRVGATLSFDFLVKDGTWHHSGKSSKGDAIYEIWSPYRVAYSK